MTVYTDPLQTWWGHHQTKAAGPDKPSMDAGQCAKAPCNRFGFKHSVCHLRSNRSSPCSFSIFNDFSSSCQELLRLSWGSYSCFPYEPNCPSWIVLVYSFLQMIHQTNLRRTNAVIDLLISQGTPLESSQGLLGAKYIKILGFSGDIFKFFKWFKLFWGVSCKFSSHGPADLQSQRSSQRA